MFFRHGGVAGLCLWVWLIFSCSEKTCTDCNNDNSLTPPLGMAVSWPNGEATFFDLDTNQIITTHYLSGESYAADFSPVGSFVAFLDSRGNQVVIYSLPEFTAHSVMQLSGTPADIQYNRTATHLFVITLNGLFFRFVVSTGHFETINVGYHPRRLAVKPLDETEAWVACAEDRTIHIISLASMTVRDTLHFTESPTDVTFAPDGGQVFVALDDGGGIYVLDAPTATIDTILAAGPGPFDIDLNSDGNYLAAADSTTGLVKLWNLDNGQTWTLDVGDGAARIQFLRLGADFYVCVVEENYVLKVSINDGGPMVTDTIHVPETVRDVALWESNR